MNKDLFYFKFHVDRYLLDDKLKACNDTALAVYPYLLAIFWKQKENQGKIILKSHQMQTGNRITDFAQIVVNYTHFPLAKAEEAIRNLTQNDVIQMEGKTLSQRGMLKDIEISIARSKGGQKGMQNRYQVKKQMETPKGEFEFTANTASEYKPFDPNTPEKIMNDFINENSWFESFQRQLNLPMAGVKTKFRDFLTEKNKEDYFNCTRSMSEIKKYFSNWLKMEKKPTFNKQPIETPTSVTIKLKK